MVKEGWERRHPALQLDLSTLSELVQPLFPGRRVVAAEPLSGGLANTNYKIAVSHYGPPLVLRLYTRDRAAARKEVEVYRLIHERIPLPEVLHADVDGLLYEHPYTITTWIEGVTLNEVLHRGNAVDVSSAAHAVGSVLAEFGSYTFPRAGFLGPGLTVDHPFENVTTSVLSYIEDRLFSGPAGQRLGEALAERLWAAVTESGSSLSVMDGVASLAHADFNASNVLLRQEADAWKIAAVLDWEFAFAGSPLFDVATMLRDEDRVPPSFEPAFIQGFSESGGELPADWRRIVKVLDLVNLCEFLNAPDAPPIIVQDVTRLLRATVERLGT